MVEIKKPKTEFYSERNEIITIRKVNIEDDKNSITFTYRKDKEGKTIVSGFDVKVYGEKGIMIQSQSDELIRYGLSRMENPNPGEL